jgi:hypothetical protein
MARASYMAPVLAIAVGMLASALRGRGQSATGGVVISLINVAILSVGALLALISLLGVGRYGSQGIVGPAAIGLTINLLLILVFLATWAQWRRSAATRSAAVELWAPVFG